MVGDNKDRHRGTKSKREGDKKARRKGEIRRALIHSGNELIPVLLGVCESECV